MNFDSTLNKYLRFSQIKALSSLFCPHKRKTYNFPPASNLSKWMPPSAFREASTMETQFFNFEPLPRKPGAYPSVQLFFKSNLLCLFAEREFIVHLKRGKQLLHHFVCNGTDVEARNQCHNLPLFFLRHTINAQCQLQKAL